MFVWVTPFRSHLSHRITPVLFYFFTSCLMRDKNKWQQPFKGGSLLKINETHALFRAVSAATDPVLPKLIGGLSSDQKPQMS